MADFDVRLASLKQRVDLALARSTAPGGGVPQELSRAIRYSLLGGGKRFRAILTLGSARLFALPEQRVMPAACALEMIHTASLIFDDLPAMDNARLRRGKPCLHLKYSQATAILAANSLLVSGFKFLADAGKKNRLSARPMAKLISGVAGTVGAEGMSGGQLMDLKMADAAGRARREIDDRKTARLFVAATWSSAVLAGAGSAAENNVSEYARLLGLSFQMIDDMIDGERTKGRKNALGKEGILIRNQLSQAKRKLASYGKAAGMLVAVADRVGETIPF
jgi:geranylgeranyl diphosphate synthase type II